MKQWNWLKFNRYFLWQSNSQVAYLRNTDKRVCNVLLSKFKEFFLIWIFVLWACFHPINVMEMNKSLIAISTGINTSYLTDSYIIFTLKMESVSKNTIFGLKMLLKSGVEKLILKSLYAGRWLFSLLNLWFWTLLWSKEK